MPVPPLLGGLDAVPGLVRRVDRVDDDLPCSGEDVTGQFAVHRLGRADRGHQADPAQVRCGQEGLVVGRGRDVQDVTAFDDLAW